MLCFKNQEPLHLFGTALTNYQTRAIEYKTVNMFVLFKKGSPLQRYGLILIFVFFVISH